MVYDRNSRTGGYDRSQSFDYGRDYGGGRDYSYSSARSYAASRDDQGRGGERGGREDGGFERDRGGYERGGHGQDQGRYGSGQDRSDYGARDYGHNRYAERGGYEAGRDRGDQYRSQDRGRYDQGRSDRDYGRQPQGYQYEDRGFMERAGDEVRSWFGDEEAERRREQDQRWDERSGNGARGHRDDDYHSWRSDQIAALDRDYDDYRRENRSRFQEEFSTWRTARQGQRDQLRKVKEHAEVVGSDGAHVGTVDKVKGDRVVLTKNDEDAGGRHHSIPCSWVTSVDDKVTLNRSAADAKQAWEDEERGRAMFGNRNDAHGDGQRGDGDGTSAGGNLNKSFSGTY